MTPQQRAVCGGIDLGGSKIETALFDADLNRLELRRRPTPRDSYGALCDALADEIAWLRDQVGSADLPVGIGMPGLVDPQTGVSVTANLPANGHTLGPDLQARAKGVVVTANDCKCFALSEANGGAGAGHARVFGLILGTGLGGGFCRDGQLDLGANGLVGEVGHYGLPAHLVADYTLPILPCGCGRRGCVETYISGTGMANLAHAMGADPTTTAPMIAAGAAAGDAQMRRVFDVWLHLTADLLHTLQLHLDPDCIVLGGGLSNIDGLEQHLAQALARVVLPSVRLPKLLKPRFGDSSGGRGAALLALQEAAR